MGVVKTTDLYYPELKDGAKFKYVVRCDRKGVFSIKMPDFVHSLTGIDEVTATTMDKVEEEYEDAIQRYRSFAIKTRKVILYNIEMTGHIDRDGQRVFEGQKMYTNISGRLLRIWAAVAIEKHADNTKRYDYEPVKSTLDYAYNLGNFGHQYDNVMDWTPEREKFFHDMIYAMEDLILAMNEMVKDQKVLEDFISAGRALPLGKGSHNKSEIADR